MSNIPHIVRKEFIQIFRDKRMLIPLFLAPVIQLVLFGFAVTTDIEHISLAVWDQDLTFESRSFTESVGSSRIFDIDFRVESYAEIEELIVRGNIKAALVISPSFGRNLGTGKTAEIEIIADGTDANSASILTNDMDQLVEGYSEKILGKFKDLFPVGRIIPQPRIWFNPELKSSAYMVPGVICLILLLTTLTLTSMAITKERETGTIEQLIVSPIRPSDLILGKTIPFLMIGLTDVGIIILAGKSIFDVPVRGSLPLLFGASLVFVLTSLGLGLFISTISHTQQQAMMTSFFFILPAMLLSGIFTPIDSMPRSIQYLTLFNPLRHFTRIVRGILLKGNGLDIIWPEILALLFMGSVAILLSSVRFKKHLD